MRTLVALRSAHGTYLSAAMDRRRVVQAATLGLTELFEDHLATSGGGGLWLRSHYGTCVSVWYEGSAHQNAHPNPDPDPDPNPYP